MGRTEMSRGELGRVEVLARVRSRELRAVDAARLLRVSYRRTSAGIRMRELPVVECRHIVLVIPAFGRCR